MTYCQVNWEKAANDYGSASVASFKKMIQTASKKIKEAEAKGGEEAVPSTPAKASPNKRKAKEDGDDEAEATPKKKAGRKPKKSAAPAEGKCSLPVVFAWYL